MVFKNNGTKAEQNPKIQELFTDIKTAYDTSVASYLTHVTNQETLDWINEYLQNSHGHHKYKLSVENVFAIDYPGDAKFQPDHNHKLLWHGTASSNVHSILKNGYKIGRTHCMFGPGIYFADCSSKSANYCHLEKDLAGTKLSEHLNGWMFLSEVALGKSYDYLQAEYTAHSICETNGFASVRGKGEYQPDFFVQYFLKDVEPYVHVPLGKLKKLARNSSLVYNEYVIYNSKRVRHRFLLKINFIPTKEDKENK